MPLIAARKLDHLAGLHVVEAVDARDAVADRQHLADLGDLGFGAEILDLLLEDRGDFRGLDIHVVLQAPFIACVSRASLALSEESIWREPTLTTSPPISDGSTCVDKPNVALEGVLERAGERRQLLGLERLRARDGRPRVRRAAPRRSSRTR